MKIQRLFRNQKNEAVDVLAAAFHDYQVMRFVLHSTGTEYEVQLNALIGFFCESRFATEMPVLGIRESDSYVAVALVDEPLFRPWGEMEAEKVRLKAVIGQRAYSRLESYEEESSRLEPAEPHYFLGMIAVHPSHQGKGYARVLLERVKEMSMEHPQSTGVCLSTEDPGNVRFYQRFGYSTIGEVHVDTLHSWCMFCPTGKNSAL